MVSFLPDPMAFMSQISQTNPEYSSCGWVSFIQKHLDSLLLVFVHYFGQESTSILTILYVFGVKSEKTLKQYENCKLINAGAKFDE